MLFGFRILNARPTPGAYIQGMFGWGQLPAPVVTGPFFILWPELSITVGICQVNVGSSHIFVGFPILIANLASLLLVCYP